MQDLQDIINAVWRAGYLCKNRRKDDIHLKIFISGNIHKEFVKLIAHWRITR